MNYFDNEQKIIEWFQTSAKKSDVLFPLASEKAVQVFETIHNTKNWIEWKNSSGKNAPPPDFYSDKYGLMMEVMRIDDHSRVSETNKLINPTNQMESKLQKELRDNGFLNLFPNANGIFINAVTDLPTKEDHNYEFYCSGFERALKKHISKIPLYKKNHPGYDVIFFVFDESSAYVQVENKVLAENGIREGEPFCFDMYWHFLDKRMVNVFKDADIDYLIWYSPFKHFESTCQYEIPTVCVYDVKNYDYSDMIDYPEEFIMSAEE